MMEVVGFLIMLSGITLITTVLISSLILMIKAWKHDNSQKWEYSLVAVLLTVGVPVIFLAAYSEHQMHARVDGDYPFLAIIFIAGVATWVGIGAIIFAVIWHAITGKAIRF